MIDKQVMIPASLNKKLTRQYLTNLSDQAVIYEGHHTRRIYGTCPPRLIQELVRRRDLSAAAAKEYRVRSDTVGPSVILDQCLARTVRQPSQMRTGLERAMRAGEAYEIHEDDMLPHTTSEDIHALITLTRNVFVARQMADRANKASRRTQRLHNALRVVQIPLPVPEQPASLPRRQHPRVHGSHNDRLHEASKQLRSH
jgi:hypothetical protein